ncbi:MAG: tRNA uridine-5-carboxymethylaminomethyl(34) synthesis GTPase MnmE [Candidatus Eisenbacteria bacterium]
MYSKGYSNDDTIVAIATAQGPSGLSVVRLSGADAFSIAQTCFEGHTPLAEVPSHTLHHGWAVLPGREPGFKFARIDEVVVGVFRAPRSYTRQDVVEFSCHGGDHIRGSMLLALMEAGARPARRGEFTLRAFLSGRIDLTQAEAVADLIHSENQMESIWALAQLGGSLSRRIGEMADKVMDCVAEVEARVDFAEDVGGIEVPAHVTAAIEVVRVELTGLLEGSEYARAVREGIRVAIAGRPNAGKSSLFNALLGEERAIVSDIPGTTRDRVSEQLRLAGIRTQLSDTAGVRATDDPVERIGVLHAEAAMDDAGLVLWVVDGSIALGAEDIAFHASSRNRRALWVLNKCDLGTAAQRGIEALALPPPWVAVSAHNGTGLDVLRDTIKKRFGGGGRCGEVGNTRHIDALARAWRLLGQASAAATAGSPGEIVALELREALAALSEVVGTHADEELLDRIFNRFCVGK